MKIYYFDNAATTQADEEVLKIYCNYQTEKFFNPSSLNVFSAGVAKEISNARKQILSILGGRGRLYFTSGGTESANLAIMGSVKGRGNIVTTKGEHAAVYNSISYLASNGYEVRYATLNKDGSVNKEDLISKIDSNTSLVAVMHVNNETGAINDIADICSASKKVNSSLLFYSDGTQAAGKIPIAVGEWNIDLYSISGHKIHAPKGIGALYVKNGVTVNPLIYGGGQEEGVRSGTENVGGMISLANALIKVTSFREEHAKQCNYYKSFLMEELKEFSPYIVAQNSSPAILCISFKGIKSQVLSNLLEQDNIIIGLGSACSSKSKAHRILAATGIDKSYIEGTIRISFSRYNSKEDVKYLAERLKHHITFLRGITK